jgi:hypothetical protein
VTPSFKKSTVEVLALPVNEEAITAALVTELLLVLPRLINA